MDANERIRLTTIEFARKMQKIEEEEKLMIKVLVVTVSLSNKDHRAEFSEITNLNQEELDGLIKDDVLLRTAMLEKAIKKRVNNALKEKIKLN